MYERGDGHAVVTLDGSGCVYAQIDAPLSSPVHGDVHELIAWLQRGGR